MSLKTKPTGRPVKHPWLIASQGETDHGRDAREADAQAAAREELAAAFAARPTEANRPQVIVRRKRVVLPVANGADERVVEAEGETRSPRVFRVDAPILSPSNGDPRQDAFPSGEPTPQEPPAPEARAMPARRRVAHDRRPHTLRHVIAPPTAESEAPDEAELLKRQLALVDRTIALATSADALRDLQRPWLTVWMPLEERASSIGRQLRALRQGDKTYVPADCPTLRVRRALDELQDRLQSLSSSADEMRELLRGLEPSRAPAKPPR